MTRLHSNLWLLLVSAAAAMSVLPFISMQWWHPYCDTPTDGPGHWGVGFPFPFAEASYSTSLDFTLLLPVYLLSLAIVTLPTFMLFRLIWHLTNQVRILLTCIVGLGAAYALLIMTTLAEPQMASKFVEGDPLSAYRPVAFVDWSHHRSCEF